MFQKPNQRVSPYKILVGSVPVEPLPGLIVGETNSPTSSTSLPTQTTHISIQNLIENIDMEGHGCQISLESFRILSLIL